MRNSSDGFDKKLQSSTSATTLPPGGIRWNRCAVLNSTDFHAGTSESSNRGLAARSWSLLFGSAARANFDMERCNSELFASHCYVLGCLHCCVGRVFVTIGLYLHATGYSGDCFLSREVGH